MTKRDFVMIAKALLKAKPHRQDSHAEERERTWEECCEMIADELTKVNPRFDRERFLNACGGGT